MNSSRLAFTFPGQGSQSVGMLGELAGAHREVEDTFEEASGVLGFDLWETVREGPQETLARTVVTQPSMLAAGVAVWRVWQARGGPAPGLLAGHSLGEFSALVCAGAMPFEDAVRAVAERASAMQAAVREGEGGIAAVLGLDDEAIVALCDEATRALGGRVASAVNFNAPGQVVIAGHADAVDAALDLAGQRGARRAIRLPMSVPVHCSLMAPAAARLRAALDGVRLRVPDAPIIHNADLATHDDPAAIRTALVEQLTSPVRWRATVETLADRGAGLLVEPGPGRVLTGLVKRIARDLDGAEVEALAVHDVASLERALSAACGG